MLPQVRGVVLEEQTSYLIEEDLGDGEKPFSLVYYEVDTQGDYLRKLTNDVVQTYLASQESKVKIGGSRIRSS